MPKAFNLKQDEVYVIALSEEENGIFALNIYKKEAYKLLLETLLGDTQNVENLNAINFKVAMMEYTEVLKTIDEAIFKLLAEHFSKENAYVIMTSNRYTTTVFPLESVLVIANR